MDLESDEWLLPEEALTQFKRPDISVLDLEDTSKSSSKKRYGFRLANIGVLVPEQTLSEVMKAFKIYPVPNTQGWFQGLTNLRGNLVPVYDLALLLGLSQKPMPHSNLLILEKGSESIGILIDNLPRPYDVSSWHPLTHTPRVPAGLTDFISEVYAANEIVWISFDHKGFFRSIKPNVAA